MLKYVHENMFEAEADDALDHLNDQFRRSPPHFLKDKILRDWAISVYQCLFEMAMAINEWLWASSAAEGLQLILRWAEAE